MTSIQGYMIRAALRLQRRLAAPTTSVVAHRAQFERATLFLSRMPDGVAVTPVTVGDRPGEWLTPPNAESDRLLLYLHGGSFMMGSPQSHRAMVARIALACRTRALLLDYRLAPEHPYPAALDDSVAAYHWLRANHADAPILLAGDSAGGGLVLSTMQRLRAAGDPLPAAGVCISPFLDFTFTGESITTRAKVDPYIRESDGAAVAYYRGEHDPCDPLLSPVFADLRGLPPLLIQVGDYEVLLSDSERLAQRAAADGVAATLEIWPGMWHVWQFFAPWMPEATRAIDRIGAWARATVG